MTERLDGLRMLVVEDDPMVRRVVVRAAREIGAAVESAEDGRAALGLLEQTRYDVVVTDLKMPVVSGLDVVRVARERHPGTALIVITGYVELEDEGAIRGAGAVLLLKPFGSEQLAEALHSARALSSPAGTSTA